MESLYHKNQRIANNEKSMRNTSLLEPFNVPKKFQFQFQFLLLDWKQDCGLRK